MNIKFNVNRKYVVNGKEYHSLEEMPDDIRNAFEKAMASQGGQGLRFEQKKTVNKITFNGTTYDSPEAMPAEVRILYDQVMSSVKSGESPSDAAMAEEVKAALADFRAEDRRGTGMEPHATLKVESSFSPKVLLAAVLFAGVLLMLYLLFHR